MRRPTGSVAAAGWAGLLITGVLATLEWVEAGPGVTYQHYPSASFLLAEAPRWTVAVVLIQLTAVLVALFRTPIRWLPPPAPGRGRVYASAALFVATSATLSLPPQAYAAELILATAIQLLHLATVLLLVASLPARPIATIGTLVDRVFGARPTGPTTPEPGGPDRFAWTLATAVAVVAAALAILSYQRHPHVPDEVVYLLQARYLAEGLLTMPLPPVPEAFNINLMFEHGGRWFSPVPPGWPFILAVGAKLGAAWLVNPLLGGINILLGYTVLRELYPRRTARLATFLLAVSPWHLFMSMNLMTHTATLTAALGATAAVARFRRKPGTVAPLVAGVCIGVVGLIRPLEGVAVALLLGLWSLGARGRRIRFGPSAAMTLVTIATGALVLPYNASLMGSARAFPIMAFTDATFGPGTNALGFGPNRGLGWGGLDPRPGHDGLDVLINGNLNLFQVNTELLGWASGSLILLLALVLYGTLRRPDWWMLAAVGMVVGLHSFYYFSGGPDFGARYWYLIIFPLLALAARGLEELESRTGLRGPAEPPLPTVSTLILIGLSLLIFVPWRASDKYHHYRGMRPDLRAVAGAPEHADGVFLIRGRRHPDYASAAVYNPIDLHSDAPIFAWDRGAGVRKALTESYPGRQFFLVDGPSVHPGGYRIMAGPLTAEELVARADTMPPPP